MAVYDDVVAAGNDFPGAKVHLSAWSEPLAQSARANSNMCASLDRGGHHKWDRRFRDLVALRLALTFAEINAQSWERQRNDAPVDLWLEAFKCWKHSPGHWLVASKQYDLFGAALNQSQSGIWFMTIVVGGTPVAPAPVPEPRRRFRWKLW